ncbi:PREDICTED: uncharacterized protein LOC109207447 [Nicotiana attenuata]|uniref:uncharacterized protein LOC109207447 n=1 Tax=Nicotiana attenuata TaxID=49451 RepID=UPI00090575C3|nr:PREDICTED: uncharacterized protein LOC109207447 [Nicotiana attenuata]
MGYRIILGRPWLHGMKVVPSTYHQLLKFSTLEGINQTRGDQPAAREMNAISVSGSKGKEHAVPEETDATKSTTEEFEQFALFEKFLERKFHLETGLHPELSSEYDRYPNGSGRTQDKPGSQHSSGKTEKTSIVEARNKFVKEEVTRLLGIGSIREVKYSDWLANVVVVPKKKNKFRMCVDYKDLNKVCQKDSFLLPNINQMIDATARNELMSLLDAYYGLKSARATYQRLVNKMFERQIGKTMKVYIDDMLVKSLNSSDHLKHLQETFDILRKHNMQLNPEKCAFGVSSSSFPAFREKPSFFFVTQEEEQLRMDLGMSACLKGFEKLLVKSSIIIKAEGRQKIINLFSSLRGNSKRHLDYESEGTQSPIYYVRKILAGAETHYPHLDMLALALVVAAQKLRTYVQYHPRAVVTTFPLRNILHKPKLSARTRIGPRIDSKVIEIKCDSQLVVNQVYGIFEAKGERMQHYVAKVQALFARFREWSITHIPRKENAKAEALANLSSSTKMKGPDSGMIVQLMLLDADNYYEVNATNLVWDWRNEIIDYIDHGKMPEDPKSSRALRQSSTI